MAMAKSKVLISDELDPQALEIFKQNGIAVDFKPGLSPEEQLKIIGEYDGLAVRSSTKVTPEMIAKAANLKVIGRAGIGVDNIDVPAATNAGIIVMNTPFGNSVTTAEHAIAMMMALARQIPQANQSTHAGKWEKKKFMGKELFNKTLGVIGCGNIGAIVADRALGLKMKVLAYDPYLSDDRAEELGVEKVSLEDLYARSDFITLHVPKNKYTENMISAGSFKKMKDGVRLINCARGGLINEADLKAALDSGKVAGAALDVFEQEPAKKNTLFNHPNVICTPHLGASTSEAQVNVALQVTQQMSDYLNSGAVTNALNMPSISAEDAPKLKPYLTLAEQMGSFAGQIAEKAITKVDIAYAGAITEMNTDPVTAVLMAHLLASQTDSVNMVNALQVADSRGIELEQSYTATSKDWRTAITLTVSSGKETRSLTGTLFAAKQPRIVMIEGVPIEAALSGPMLYLRNNDEPGFIGAVGSILGKARLNIADFRLGRKEGAKSAVALITLDQPCPDKEFEEICGLPQILQAKRLSF